jgi:hypothetical protein
VQYDYKTRIAPARARLKIISVTKSGGHRFGKTTEMEASMISLEDVIGFSDLTPEEVHAIAEHEHIADTIAAMLGLSLLRTEHGPKQIRDILIDDIRVAVRRHDVPHARQLVSTLRHFLHAHPDARIRQAA